MFAGCGDHGLATFGEVDLPGPGVTRATSLKVRHVAHSPYLSCSYWEPGHEVAGADCAAEWVSDVATRQRVWELYRDAPPPLGYDFWSVFPEGPAGEAPALLRLTPYRLRLSDVETLGGRKAALAWPLLAVTAVVPSVKHVQT